jgi:hypothetical protein
MTLEAKSSGDLPVRALLFQAAKRFNEVRRDIDHREPTRSLWLPVPNLALEPDRLHVNSQLLSGAVVNPNVVRVPLPRAAKGADASAALRAGSSLASGRPANRSCKGRSRRTSAAVANRSGVPAFRVRRYSQQVGEVPIRGPGFDP